MSRTCCGPSAGRGLGVVIALGAVDLAVPQDRKGSFEPQIVRKGQTRLEGFSDRIIALYARGMTTAREALMRAGSTSAQLPGRGRIGEAWLMELVAMGAGRRPSSSVRTWGFMQSSHVASSVEGLQGATAAELLAAAEAGDEQIVALRCRPLTTWSATAGPSGAPGFHRCQRIVAGR